MPEDRRGSGDRDAGTVRLAREPRGPRSVGGHSRGHHCHLLCRSSHRYITVRPGRTVSNGERLAVIGCRPPSAHRQRLRNPIAGRGVDSWIVKARIASNTLFNVASYFDSSSSSRWRRSEYSACIRRSRTNVRTISMLTAIARGLFSTLDSIATPCSVKASGVDLLRPPLRNLRFQTLELLHS